MTGVIDQPTARLASVALGTALASCAGGTVGAFPAPIALAPDMPFVAGASPADPCDGISFARALHAGPAKLVGQQPDAGSAVADAGCPY